MFKNLIIKNSPQKIKIMHKIINVNSSFVSKKSKSNTFFVLFFLMLANLGFSQLTVQNFNTGIPATWAIASNMAVVNNWVPTPTGGYQSTGGATVNPASNSTVGNHAEYFMITPQFTTPANGEIRFLTKQGSFTNKGATYQVRISLANQPDISSFNVVLATWTETQLNVAATTYEEKIIPIPTIPANIPVYIAFVAMTDQVAATPNSYGDSWFVDNVRVIPACTPVTGITTVMGADTAVINWTHPTATQFGIEVVAHGAGHGATGIPVTGTTYTATGLTANTQYDVYIITNCDATTSSSWAGPFVITTATIGLSCASPIIIPPNVSTTPYILSSNLANYYTDNYTPYTSLGTNCFPTSTSNQLLGNHIYFNYTPTTTGLINISQSVNAVQGGGSANCYNSLSSVSVYNSCADIGVSCLAAITTTPVGNYGVFTNQINDFYVQAGQTYVILMASPFQHTNPGAGLCFTFSVSGATCPSPSPSGTTYNNLTQTAGNFSWNNVGNLVSSWQYVALPVSSGAPTGATILTTTNTNLNNPATGLIPATDYNLYVRAVCGGTPGPWASPFPFTTPCNPFSLPYYTGFNTGDATMSCWSNINLNNDINFFTFGNDAGIGGGHEVAKIRPQNSNDMLVSPQLHFDGVTQKRLRFKYSIYGNWGLISSNPTGGPGSFEIRYSTTGSGPTSFTNVILPLASYMTAYNYIEKIVPLPAGLTGDVNIAWILPQGAVQTGGQTYFEDVYIEDLPACSEPAYPVVTPGTLTSNSVEISWTNGYQNTQWQLVAQPLGTGTPTSTPAPGAVINIVNTNPYTITGLNSSTQYEFYMRAYCSPTVQSIWVGPIYFNTICTPEPTPYFESLNSNDPTTKKFCWSINNQNADNTRWVINANDATISQAPVFQAPFPGFDDWLKTGPVNAVGMKRLHFNYRVIPGIFAPGARANYEVLMSTTPTFSTYTTLIPSHDIINPVYMEDSVIFSGTGVIYVAFRIPPTMTDPADSGILFIDDVVIEDAPACPNPSGLAITAITPTTANLSWTIGFTETQWQVKIQAQGSGIPTGSGTTVNTTPTYTATGLTQDTAYEYYVRAVCNATDSSSWVGPFLFRTTCNPLPTPFLETFDTTSATESCWAVVNGNGNAYKWGMNQTVNPIFGDQMAAIFSGTNGDNDDWLITPTLMAHAGQRLRFYYKVYNDFFTEDLKVKLSTNGAAVNQFTTLLYENSLSVPTDATGTVTGSNTLTMATTQGIRTGDVVYIPGWPFPYLTTVTNITGSVITLSQNATVTLTGVQVVQFSHEVINNEEVREMVIDLTSITSPTNINIGFYIPQFPPNPWNYRSQFLFIDNVIVEDIPACPTVINVTASNIVDTSATINWQTTGSATSWQISVQPFGTPAPVGATLPAYLHTTTTHPYNLTGLTPATQYQYYIRAICSGTSQSQWVGPFELLTRCDFANVCQYTITTISGNSGQVTQSVNVMQNGQVVQELEFPGFGQTIINYTVFLCTGVAFNLYWLGQGSGTQYSQAQIIVKDESNNIVWTSPLGLGTVNTNIYSGFATCGTITCAQPTNLTVSNQGVLSWTPGTGQTQWEVFVQPLGNGTLPVSGQIVNTPSYTPIASDFVDASAGTYEYFVRAICGPTNKSFWSGPKVFIRNDEATTSVHLQVNSNEDCNVSGVDASFIGATASSVPTSCAGINGGDIWYDFVATSKIHYIALSDFTPGSYYSSSYAGSWPKMIMSLYEVQTDGSLVEKGCSENNSMTTMYTTELVVGNTYKIRLKLNNTILNDKKFHICITTPNDLCNVNAFNYGLEKLPMQYIGGVSTILDSTVIPGWRTSTDWGTMFFLDSSNNIGALPYSGGQFVQLTQDGTAAWNPNDPNIKGLYKDFDTSEITKMDYSFASSTRSGSGTTLKLYAGPPGGPFTVVTQDVGVNSLWHLVQGSYNVPTGQTNTRFIFRVDGNAIGHLLDAANFKANVNIDIASASTTLDCVTTNVAFNAYGVGHWEAAVNNPGASTIATPTSNSVNITGITIPGSYTFHWITRYCDKTITIIKQGTNAVAVATTAVSYCVSQTAVPLTATPPSGNTLMWYTQPTGGTGTTTAPTPLTTTAGNTSYYVSVADQNGCQGPRTQIVVTVNALPTAVISGGTTICSGGTATLTFTGTPNATVTYTVNSGSNQTITLNGTGTATTTTPALTAASTYALVGVASAGANSCNQTQSGAAVINVNALPTATIAGSTAVCSGGTATVTFTGTPNATVTYTINSGGNQTIVLNGAGTATVTTAALTANATYALVGVASSGQTICSQTQSGSAIITVNALPTATITGATTICSGGTTTITFTGTPNATVTYTVNSGSNQTIVLNGTGTATVTTPSLTAASTYALVNVTASGSLACNQTVTGSAVVNIVSLPTATISGSSTICSGGTATVTFTGTPNATVTYTINSGPNQTITLNGTGTATITTPALTANRTYTLVSVIINGTTPCSQVQTGSVVITVNQAPIAAISGTTSVCPNGTAVITFTGTPNATVTYTINSGGNQTIVLNGAGNASVTTPVLTVNATYTLVSVASTEPSICSQTQTGSAIVTVVALPTATISGTTSVCPNGTATITFNGTPNATVTYTINSGGNQTIVLNATGTATVTTPALTVNTTYTLVSVATSGSTSCNQNITGTATITINSSPTASISGATTICSGATAVITFTGTPNATVTYTVNSGSNQTIVLNGTGTGTATVTTPPLTANSTYTLVSVATATCSQTLTGSVTVTVTPLPTATISGTSPICSGNATTVTFNGTPNAIVTYTINSGANQTITLNGVGTASITTPIVTANSTYTLVSVTSGGTPACTQTLSASATIVVNPLTPQNLVFSYATTCLNAASNPLPVLTANFATGGVFSSTSVTVNPTTGAVNLATATIGTHTITYTLASSSTNCTLGGTSNATININAGVAPVTAFNYNTTYCSDATNVLPTTSGGFTSGGLFTSTPGLSINSSTGLISIPQSTPGTYTITYTVAANVATCNIGGSSSDTITINAAINVTVEDDCLNQLLVLNALPLNNSFNPDTVSYTWTDANNAVVGNSDTLSVDDYFSLHPTATYPITFTVTVTSNGCNGTATFTVNDNPCRLIPKGISPNGDGDNDTFDLTGLGVTEITIFNRYGTKVYSFNGNYTNQWTGAADNGNELSDGTYFYSIVKNNATTVTGWVYINK